MKKTAYLLLDDNEGYAPRYVYESQDIAERLSTMMPYSVVEVTYYVPNTDTWGRIEDEPSRDCPKCGAEVVE
jgi:hypothetical protein